MDEKIVIPIIQKCREALEKHYGQRLKGIILYGSMARGEAGSASDIDLLVLLSPPFDYFAELRQIVDLLYPVQLESERLISAKPALASDYELGSISLYRNARREGVAVYGNSQGENTGKLKVSGSLQYTTTDTWSGPFNIEISDASGQVTMSDHGTFNLTRIAVEFEPQP